MNIDNFCNLGAALQNKQIEVGKQPQIYFYRSNEDSIYEMLSEGYFNALNLRVAKDDLILLYSPKDEKKVFAKVISNNGGIVQIMEISEDDFQHYEMPTPSIEYLNKIVQYIGNTTADYTNGFFYKCVENSGVYSWEDIVVQDSYLKSETYNKTETDTELAKKLNTDGSNTFTGVLKMRSTVSFKGAVAPSWSGIGIYELKDDDSVSLMASMEKTDGFTPASNNTYNIGVNSRKWKDLYLAGKAYIPTINNGEDIAIPTSAGTMALTSDLTNFADKDLSNLTSQGKNIANWSSNVSNCITYIPQDIKLELNAGTLTLKEGSKVYVPNGAGVFDAITISSDLTLSPVESYTGYSLLYVHSNGSALSQGLVSESISGTTPPSGNGTWYDTATNLIKAYSGGSDTGTRLSFPIARIHRTSGTWDSIEQVFNGFGYIGSTVFALPGVKGLIPDGRNADGTLKSIEITVENVLTSQVGGTVDAHLLLNASGFYASNNTFNYNINENFNYQNNNKLVYLDASLISISSGVITNFKFKNAFHALDYNDTSYIGSQSKPSSTRQNLTLLATGQTYTMPVNGKLYFGRQATAAGQIIDMYNLTTGDRLQTQTATNNTYCLQTIEVSKGDIVQVNYTTAGTINGFYIIYDKGEV